MTEPTNTQLQDGTWSQPPGEATARVPEGVYAKLAEARASYRELPALVAHSYAVISDSKQTLTDFIQQGDTTHEMATRLTVASESNMFDRIVVLLPHATYRSNLGHTAIGIITTLDGARYFQIDEPASDKWSHEQVVQIARKLRCYSLVATIVVTIALAASGALTVSSGSWWWGLLVFITALVEVASITVVAGCFAKKL